MALQLFLRLPGAGLRACQAQPGDSVASVSGLDAFEAAVGAAARVVCSGRTLDPCSSLAAARVPPGATLELLPRLRGGGGDGGSTGAESRSCYLEMYAGRKADKVNPEEERLARWTSCQLSGMPLQPPCVADELGSLFNKDAVLQALLNKSMPKPLAHITSLKHLIELKLGDGSSGGGSAAAAPTSKDGGDVAARFACPITGLPFNGKSRFVVLRRSGHVLSERALKEVPKVVEEMVGGPWQPQDLLPVNPAGDELQGMREALLLKRTAERAAKKEKKKDKATAAAAAGNGGAAAAAAAAAAPAAGENGKAGAGGKRPAENGGTAGGAAAAAAASGGGDPAAAAAAAKRFKAAELKPKGADDKVWSSIFTSSGKQQGRNDYMVRGFSRYV
ncbi:hypothetical protein ABPG75_012327 [Micractinium tetrahymenae]